MVNTGTWRAAIESVSGYRYRDMPDRANQDHVDSWEGDGADLPLVMAVADGHGDPRYFRSHIGARVAVLAAKELLHTIRSADSMQQIDTEKWRQELVNRWRKLTQYDVYFHPFRDEELKGLPPPFIRELQERPEVPYGATLLAIAISQEHMVFVQIGDGDILTVDTDGKVSRPLPEDSQCLGNSTTSLCLPESWRHLRVRIRDLTADPTEMVLLSTDGCSNSFHTEKDFEQLGADILGLVRESGLDEVKANLRQWLTEYSRVGSGDDLSLGLVHRTNPESESAETSSPIPTEDSPPNIISSLDELRNRVRMFQEVETNHSALLQVFNEQHGAENDRMAILAACLVAGVPGTLVRWSKCSQHHGIFPYARLVQHETSRLRDQTDLSSADAIWGVNWWAETLGLQVSAVPSRQVGETALHLRNRWALLATLLLLGLFSGIALDRIVASGPNRAPLELPARTTHHSDAGFRRLLAAWETTPGEVTRAEYVKLLMDVTGATLVPGGQPTFNDVAAHWAHLGGYIPAAQRAGVVEGYPDHSFRPDAPITLAEAIKMTVSVMETGAVLQGTSDLDRWPNLWVSRGMQTRIVGPAAPFQVYGLTPLDWERPLKQGEALRLLANLVSQPSPTLTVAVPNTVVR